MQKKFFFYLVYPQGIVRKFSDLSWDNQLDYLIECNWSANAWAISFLDTPKQFLSKQKQLFYIWILFKNK